MKTLTTTRALGTANRWRVLTADPIESLARMRITVQLINNGNAQVALQEVLVHNGPCDRVSIDTAPNDLGRSLVVEAAALNLPTGYTDAFDAYRVGANMAARRDALETWMLTTGVAGANLAGS